MDGEDGDEEESPGLWLGPAEVARRCATRLPPDGGDVSRSISALLTALGVPPGQAVGFRGDGAGTATAFGMDWPRDAGGDAARAAVEAMVRHHMAGRRWVLGEGADASFAASWRMDRAWRTTWAAPVGSAAMRAVLAREVMRGLALEGAAVDVVRLVGSALGDGGWTGPV